ncbi:hypothetical protein [Acidithiobacillus sp.]
MKAGISGMVLQECLNEFVYRFKSAASPARGWRTAFPRRHSNVALVFSWFSSQPNILLKSVI